VAPSDASVEFPPRLAGGLVNPAAPGTLAVGGAGMTRIIGPKDRYQWGKLPIVHFMPRLRPVAAFSWFMALRAGWFRLERLRLAMVHHALRPGGVAGHRPPSPWTSETSNNKILQDLFPEKLIRPGTAPVQEGAGSGSDYHREWRRCRR
jgi:hypothetical protein